MDCNVAVLLGVLASVVTILVPIFAFLGFLYREIRTYRQETGEEIHRIEREIFEIRKGFREEMLGFREEMRMQSQRSDQLYQMFIDLLKSQSPRTNP